jgi:hypothetical protein
MARNAFATFLLGTQAVLIGWVGWRSCPNNTETAHMAAAVYSWETLRFDVFCVNPPLTRVITGVPAVLCRLSHDWSGYSPRPQDRCEWTMGTAFVVANSPERVHWCFALARWSLVPLLSLGGYFGFRLANEMYGSTAGIVFLLLWCFSPLLLAWGGTICPDATAAAAGLVAVYTFRRWLFAPTWTRAAIAGIFLGLLLLTKITWIAALGLWPLIWCVWTVPIYLIGRDKRSLPVPPLRQLVAMTLLGLYVLNMGYLFDGTFRSFGKYEFISQSFCGRHESVDSDGRAVGNRVAGTWLGAIPVPLPADFLQGIDTQRLDFERGMPSYLRGQWADHGWWYYYLYVLLVKMPLGTWGLALLATAVAVWELARRSQLARRAARVVNSPSPPAPLPAKEGSVQSSSPAHLTKRKGTYIAPWRDEMLILLPCAALFLLVSSQTGFSKHPRYILPALPFFFVAISRVGVAFTRKARVMAALAGIFLAYTIASSLSIYPHSMCYFNELAALFSTPADALYPKPHDKGGERRGLWSNVKDTLAAGPRNGPRHLLDSNIDWGQDLFYLEDWYVSHPEAQQLKVAYFGSYPLEKSKIESTGSPPAGLDREHVDTDTDTTAFGPLPGWYALSVNEIYGQSQRYRYFLNFQPAAMAGYSIYIYHITPEEANRVRREMGLKPLLTSDCIEDSENKGQQL